MQQRLAPFSKCQPSQPIADRVDPDQHLHLHLNGLSLTDTSPRQRKTQLVGKIKLRKGPHGVRAMKFGSLRKHHGPLGSPAANFLLVPSFASVNWNVPFVVQTMFYRGSGCDYGGLVNCGGYYRDSSWEIRLGREDDGSMGGCSVFFRGDHKEEWDILQCGIFPPNEWHTAELEWDGQDCLRFVADHSQVFEKVFCQQPGPSSPQMTIQSTARAMYVGTADSSRCPFVGYIAYVKVWIGVRLDAVRAHGDEELERLRGSLAECPRTLSVPMPHYHVRIRGEGLDKKDLFGKSDPYFKLFVENEKGKWKKMIHESEVVKKSLDPDYEPFHIPPGTVQPTQEVQIKVWDWNRLKKHNFIGAGTFCFADIVLGRNRITLLNPKKGRRPAQQESGTMVVERCMVGDGEGEIPNPEFSDLLHRFHQLGMWRT